MSVDSDLGARRVNHEEKASSAARTWFSWLNPLLDVGNSRQLDFTDLDPLPQRDGTKLWADKFEADCCQERRRPSPSLLRVLHHVFGGEWYAAKSGQHLAG